jgi:hypothetical protein
MERVEIRIKGQLDGNWSDRFGGLAIAHTTQGETILAGPIRDQAELRGVLYRLSDLGLALVSLKTSPRVNRLSRRIREEVMDGKKERINQTGLIRRKNTN